MAMSGKSRDTGPEKPADDTFTEAFRRARGSVDPRINLGITEDEHSIHAAKNLIRSDGTVPLDELVGCLRASEAEVAIAVGLPLDALSRPQQLASPITRLKVKELAEILVQVAPWAGSLPQAFAWFSTEPLPSFGNQTAAMLVREGRANAVKAYVSRIAGGGYT